MSQPRQPPKLAGEDEQLVDLVGAVLVDPNLHTDLRMRLQDEITALLRDTREDLYGPAGAEVHQRALEAHGDHVPSLLTDVLVDPNLHTDLRMRLYGEIRGMLAAHAAKYVRGTRARHDYAPVAPT